MMQIAEMAGRLRRLAKRREDDGIYTDANLCEEVATHLEATGEAKPVAFGVFSKHGDLSGYGPTEADAEASVEGGLWDGDYIAPLYAAPVASPPVSEDAVERALREARRVIENIVQYAGEEGRMSDDENGDAAWFVERGTEALETIDAALSSAPSTPKGWRELREAFEAARYVPGDHPIVPVKIDRFMKTVDRLLDNLPTPPAGDGDA